MAPHNKYEAYYLTQAGTGQFYAGRAHMRGYGGVADFFKGIFRTVFPFLKSAGRTVATEGAKAAMHMLTDVTESHVPLKESLKRRAADASENLTRKFAGAGYKRPRVLYKDQLIGRPRRVQTKKKRAPPRRSTTRDIFS